MAVEIPASKIALALARQIVPPLKASIEHCGDYNDLPNVPWHLRQQVRTIQGFLEKAETEIVDMLSMRLFLDEALDYVEKEWPSD